jgi:D-glycero-D-manno-heptose 1,7-bisphosphate phosphatase
MARPTLFVDRDGTLSYEIGYVNHASRFRLFPWAADAVRMANQSGWLIVLVTNQAGVARGYFPESVIHEVHAGMERALAQGGARLDAVYYCPHHPTAGEPPWRQDCDCRKPRPGLLRRAERELGADLARSWVVGDRLGDLELAWRVGARGALVRSGYGLGELTHHAPRWPRQPDLVAENLLEAVRRIVGGGGAGTAGGRPADAGGRAGAA